MSFHTIFGSTLSYNLCFQDPRLGMQEYPKDKSRIIYLCIIIFSAKGRIQYYKKNLIEQVFRGKKNVKLHHQSAGSVSKRQQRHYETIMPVVIPLLINSLACPGITQPIGQRQLHTIPFWNRVLMWGDLEKTDFDFVHPIKNVQRTKISNLRGFQARFQTF